MTKLFPDTMNVGEALPATSSNEITRHFIAKRRSSSTALLSEPGPTGSTLDEILQTAMRVPDHRRLGPWRFIVFEGEARMKFGQAAAEVRRGEIPDAPKERLDISRRSMLRAPTVVAVISSPKDCPKGTPVWEQELSVGAACYNLLLAANAAGFAGCWLTEWMSFSDGINDLLGLQDNERVAGFIYLGTATGEPQERMRPNAAERISHWKG
ncbi:MAG: nitroreductase [Pseudomonadota bacterium]